VRGEEEQAEAKLEEAKMTEGRAAAALPSSSTLA
jgi:hypothetical protein